MSVSGHKGKFTKDTLFQGFKYTVYLLIFINVLYFLREDFDASAYTFHDGLSWSRVGDAFATAIDSFSWLLLLLLFELETYVIPDDRLKGWLKWGLSAFAGLCYVFLVIAFLGYFDRMEMTYGFDVAKLSDACAYVGDVMFYAIEIDDYAELTAASCQLVPAGQLYINPNVSILADRTTLVDMHRLSMTDVVNAAAWLLVVVVLQVDVMLQVTGELTRGLYRINVAIKAAIYTTLIIACLYWLYLGAWIDGWDAFLWLLAFIVIELNLFKWHEASVEEEEEEAAHSNTTHGAEA